MIKFDRELTNDEVKELLLQYKEKDESHNLDFSGFEHHLDPACSRILYCLLREYQPSTVLEFGTSEGGSGKVIVQALLRNDKPFTYTGFEIEDGYKKEAIKNITSLSPENVKIYGDITKNLDKVPDKIDFAFIDPNQDLEITMWWLKNILPRIKTGGLVQIHDWSLRQVDGEFHYEGGNFPGINYLMNLLKFNMFPFRKIFCVWDYPEYRDLSVAASFWIKEKELE